MRPLDGSNDVTLKTAADEQSATSTTSPVARGLPGATVRKLELLVILTVIGTPGPSMWRMVTTSELLTGAGIKVEMLASSEGRNTPLVP